MIFTHTLIRVARLLKVQETNNNNQLQTLSFLLISLSPSRSRLFKRAGAADSAVSAPALPRAVFALCSLGLLKRVVGTPDDRRRDRDG